MTRFASTTSIAHRFSRNCAAVSSTNHESTTRKLPVLCRCTEETFEVFLLGRRPKPSGSSANSYHIIFSQHSHRRLQLHIKYNTVAIFVPVPRDSIHRGLGSFPTLLCEGRVPVGPVRVWVAAFTEISFEVAFDWKVT